MKVVFRTALAVFLTVLMVGSLAAKKTRKLPAKAYITSAKIEIIGAEKEEDRIWTAQAMLDSLFMHYGPHSEGYYWYSQIQWDLMTDEADLKKKLPFVTKAVTYADSLKWSCDNKDIRKNYRKNCGEFDEQMDSIRVSQWREYYNSGVSQITEVEELMETVKVETDSAALAYYQTRLDALVDSCQDNMALAISIDDSDAKPFVGLASVNEKIDKFEKAIEYLTQALPLARNRTELLVEVAYDYIRMDDYCGAIPWFQEYVDSMVVIEEVMNDPDNRAAVIGIAHNLASCYNNCKQFDASFETSQSILALEPDDETALLGIGRYFQHIGREAGDSSKTYRQKDDEAAATKWTEERNVRFDSAIVYLQKAFTNNNDDAKIAAEAGLMLAIRQRYEEAKVGFARACELEPENVDYWISLGDCTLQAHDWAIAADAYEHVVEFEPENKAVWENLADLYQQLRNKTRRAEILQKLKNM